MKKIIFTLLFFTTSIFATEIKHTFRIRTISIHNFLNYLNTRQTLAPEETNSVSALTALIDQHDFSRSPFCCTFKTDDRTTIYRVVQVNIDEAGYDGDISENNNE